MDLYPIPFGKIFFGKTTCKLRTYCGVWCEPMGIHADCVVLNKTPLGAKKRFRGSLDLCGGLD